MTGKAGSNQRPNGTKPSNLRPSRLSQREGPLPATRSQREGPGGPSEQGNTDTLRQAPAGHRGRPLQPSRLTPAGGHGLDVNSMLGRHDKGRTAVLPHFYPSYRPGDMCIQLHIPLSFGTQTSSFPPEGQGLCCFSWSLEAPNSERPEGLSWSRQREAE